MSIKSKIKKVASKVVSKAKQVLSNVRQAAQNVKPGLGTAGNVSNVASGTRTVVSSVGNAASKIGNLAGVGASQSSRGGLDYSGSDARVASYNNLTSGVSTAQKSQPRTVSVSSSSSSGSRTLSSGGSSQNFSDPAYSFDTYSDMGSAPRNIQIDSSTMGGVTPTGLIGSAPGTNSVGNEALANVGLGADPATGLFTRSTEESGVSPEEQAQLDYLKFQKSYKKPPSKADAYNQAQEESGVDEARQRVNNTQSQIDAITARANADLLQLRGTAGKEGVVEAVYGGQQAAIKREAAIKLLPLQAQLATDQGNLEMAEERLNTLFDIYYTDAKNSVDAYNKQKDDMWEFMSEQEKRKLDTLAKDKESNLAQARDIMNFQQQLMMQAMKDGNLTMLSQLKKLRPPVNTNSKDYAKELMAYEQAVNNAVSAMPAGGGGSGEVSATVQNYADLLAQGKITLSNVPQNIRNQVVAYTGANISKPLSDTAVKEIQQSESAVANLQALRTTVENNLQFVGPVSGLARLNPYSEARKVQAEIDRVRQQVGKTLEGGVLRKEDEEKYKKILATLSDTPETALYKIDALISSITRDVEAYKSIQQETGRYIPGGTESKPEDLRAKYNY